MAVLASYLFIRGASALALSTESASVTTILYTSLVYSECSFMRETVGKYTTCGSLWHIVIHSVGHMGYGLYYYVLVYYMIVIIHVVMTSYKMLSSMLDTIVHI